VLKHTLVGRKGSTKILTTQRSTLSFPDAYLPKLTMLAKLGALQKFPAFYLATIASDCLSVVAMFHVR